MHKQFTMRCFSLRLDFQLWNSRFLTFLIQWLRYRLNWIEVYEVEKVGRWRWHISWRSRRLFALSLSVLVEAWWWKHGAHVVEKGVVNWVWDHWGWGVWLHCWQVLVVMDELASWSIRAVTCLSIFFAIFGFVLSRYITFNHKLMSTMSKWTLQNWRS